MSDTRRMFLKAGTALATGLAMGGVNEEISRLVLGTNPFYGFSHFSANLDFSMREWFTPERICETMRRCAPYGINAFNYVNLGRSTQDFRRFLDEGGKLHLIAQIIGDPAPTWKEFRPLAMYNQGEQVDKAFLAGQMDTVKEWCKKARDLGTLVGVGTHKPEVIAYVEERGWDVDFYAGCLYNRTRTMDEWKQVLNGETQEMPQETYLRSDPARMYKVMRQTKKPCFAFKVLAAARIGDKGVEQAFRTAFENLKPIDGIFVGMWPCRKDEIRENAELVTRILTSPRA
jgi:hypothetical protein